MVDYVTIGGNITASIGLLQPVFEGILAVIPSLIPLSIMLGIAAFAGGFLNKVLYKV